MEKRFDIIVYGASGFASKYIIEELLTHNISLAISGRSAKRIKANIKDVRDAEDIEIIEATIENIDLVTKQTRLLINCAGPYIFSGEKIIESCLSNGTHYIDLSGETFFIEKCKRFDEQAREKGLYVINSCGFDSVPADLGVCYFKECVLKDCRTDTLNIESFLVLKDCYINKTTYDSAIYGIGKSKETKRLRNKTPGTPKSTVKKLFYDDELKSYCSLFPGTDASVVKRSQAVLSNLDNVSVNYHAYVKLGNFFKTSLTTICGVMFYLLALTHVGRFFLLNFSYIFTLGYIKRRRPTVNEISRGTFEFLFRTEVDGKQFKMSVSGPDPGYVSTAIFVSECAVLLLEKAEKTVKGGVVTPAIAFHDSDLVERLRQNCIRFDYVE